MILPTDPAARKRIPLFTGCISYFPRALSEIAKVSLRGNEQHHPGAPLHWDKSTSTDQLDAQVRHMVDSLDPDVDRIEALAQAAWRALAELETACETRHISPPIPVSEQDKTRLTAAELAERDGAGEYGNPVTPDATLSADEAQYFALNYGFVPGESTPGCATPWKLP